MEKERGESGSSGGLGSCNYIREHGSAAAVPVRLARDLLPFILKSADGAISLMAGRISAELRPCLLSCHQTIANYRLISSRLLPLYHGSISSFPEYHPAARRPDKIAVRGLHCSRVCRWIRQRCRREELISAFDEVGLSRWSRTMTLFGFVSGKNRRSLISSAVKVIFKDDDSVGFISPHPGPLPGGEGVSHSLIFPAQQSCAKTVAFRNGVAELRRFAALAERPRDVRRGLDDGFVAEACAGDDERTLGVLERLGDFLRLFADSRREGPDTAGASGFSSWAMAKPSLAISSGAV